jgi:hypothetical protein
MNTYVNDLLYKYKTKGAVLDANLLLLYIVGKYSKKLIANFKRTVSYSEEDFEIVNRFVAWFNNSIATTPNILTEVSNLSGQLGGGRENPYFEEFKRQVVLIDEKYIKSSKACENIHLGKYGLTDIGIIMASKGNYLVFTDDFKLSSLLEHYEIDFINMNHIRTQLWLR